MNSYIEEVRNMTRNEANELRIKHCNLPLLEGSLYDPDNEYKNVGKNN